MTPERQNIVIAEACGVEPELVSWLAQKGDCSCYSAERKWEVEEWLAKLPAGSWAADYKPAPLYRYPDYATNLNAIAGAEKILTQEQRFDFFYALNEAVGLVDPASPAWIKETAVVALVQATAAQRSEAFLKTLGLWEAACE